MAEAEIQMIFAAGVSPVPDRKLSAMHREYGKAYGHQCSDCQNLLCYEANRRWYKCRAYGMSASEATDWAKSWQACGLWGTPFEPGCIPLVRRLQRTRADKPVKGQLSMFDTAKEENPLD